MPKTGDGRLTKRQREFCEEYIKDYNLTRAYGRVYTTAAAKNWASLASKLFADARIKEYVRQLEEQVFQEKGINAEHIAVELAKIAFEDPEASRADKMKAIELLSKQLNLYTQKVEVKDGLTIKVDIDNGDQT